MHQIYRTCYCYQQLKMSEQERGGNQILSYIQNLSTVKSQVILNALPNRQGYFNQNSLIYIRERKHETLYVPAYLRCHFRTMTEMDIQNLSCSFYATMNITFYLGKFERQEDKQKALAFAKKMHQTLKKELKITFQNDFVINLQEDISSNISDSDRLVRDEFREYTTNGVTRYYSSILITREFKFGLHSDIFFFPLQQNILDLVTTLNPIKIKLSEKRVLTIRFNCMDLELGRSLKSDEVRPLEMSQYEAQNPDLMEQLKALYMQEHKGKQLSAEVIDSQFASKESNHPFFRDIRISFPLRKNATEFGYYNVIQKDVRILYTREKQLAHELTCYERFKNVIFCKKQIINYDQSHNQLQMMYGVLHSSQVGVYQRLSSVEDRSKEASYCNAIMSIPLLKASLGIIIQLCVPILFLSFLTLVEFLYSTSTTLDQVRGQKIGSSTLIVATYISFIYLMRNVIPPTPSWSIFEVAVCLLAASCLAPIVQSIYQQNINNTDNPFVVANGLFLASFILNAALCVIVAIMLLSILFYMNRATKRHRSVNVSMNDLLASLTKKHFYLWRNYSCKKFLFEEINGVLRQRGTVKLEQS